MKILKLMLFSVVLLGCGCSSGPEYIISINNLSGEDISDAHVYYDDFISVGGNIPKGGISSHFDPKVPIPPFVNIKWRDATGILRKETVQLEKVSTKYTHIEIRFVVQPNQKIDIKILDWDEEDK